MNPESEDKRIKELFLELKRDEARQAPVFEMLWANASERLAANRWRGYFQRVGAAAAVLVALGMAIAWVFSRPGTRPLPLVVADGRQRETTALPWRSVVLVSEWHTPTDFLLEYRLKRASPNRQQFKSSADTLQNN